MEKNRCAATLGSAELLFAVLKRSVANRARALVANVGLARVVSVLAVFLVTSAVLVTVETSPSEAAIECRSSASDPDGDGWGWEDGVTCKVIDDGHAQQPNATAASAPSDQVGSVDGAAPNESVPNEPNAQPGVDTTESGAEGESNKPNISGTPDCSSAGLDPDGDGFGWENNTTCRVVPGSEQADQPDAQPSVPVENGQPSEAQSADQQTPESQLVESPETERQRQATQFTDRLDVRLDQDELDRYETLIDAVGLVVDAAVVSNGDSTRVASVLWRLEGQLRNISVCDEHAVVVSELFAERLVARYDKDSSSIGEAVADMVGDLTTAGLGGDGKIAANRDVCAAESATDYPNCTDLAIDPDGDGFGWESNATCRVVTPGVDVSADLAPEESAGGQATSDQRGSVADLSTAAEQDVEVEETNTTLDNPPSQADPNQDPDPAEPLVDVVEPSVDSAEVSVDVVQSSVDSAEPLVDLVEPLVDVVKPLVDVVEPSVDVAVPAIVETVANGGAEVTASSGVGGNREKSASDSGVAGEATIANVGEYPFCLSDRSGGFGWEQNMSCLADALPLTVTSTCPVEEWIDAGFVYGKVGGSSCAVASVPEPSDVETLSGASQEAAPESDNSAPISLDDNEVEVESLDSTALQTTATETTNNDLQDSAATSSEAETDASGTELEPDAARGDLPVCASDRSGGLGFEGGRTCLALISDFAQEPSLQCPVLEWYDKGFPYGFINNQWCVVTRPANYRGPIRRGIDAVSAIVSGDLQLPEPEPTGATTSTEELRDQIVEVGVPGDLPLCMHAAASNSGANGGSGSGTVDLSGSTENAADETSFEQGMVCLVLNFSPQTGQVCTVASWVATGFEQGRQGGRWCNVVRGPPPAADSGLGVVQNLKVEHVIRQGYSIYSWGAGLVEWDAPLGGSPTRYDVLRDGQFIASVTPGAVNSYLDLGFVSGRTHYYTVSAVDDSGATLINGAPTTTSFFFDPDQGHLNEFGPNQDADREAARNVDDGFDDRTLRPIRNLRISQTEFEVELVAAWDVPTDGPAPTGYQIIRDDRVVALVDIPYYYDNNVEVGKHYTYTVSPFILATAADGSATRVDGLGLSTQSEPILPVPESITSSAVSGVTVEQRPGTTQVEISWNAPVGWAQGLIDEYVISRNGTMISTINEPDFAAAGELPYQQRSYLDTMTEAGETYGYSIIPVTTRSGERVYGEASPLLVISPIETDPVGQTTDTGTGLELQEPVTATPGATVQEIPQRFIDAVTSALGVSGVDAERLGSQLYLLHTLRGTAEFQDHLVYTFNRGVRSSPGAALGFTDEELAQLPAAEAADELLRRISAANQGTNVGVLIEGYGMSSPFLNTLRSNGESIQEKTDMMVQHMTMLHDRRAELERITQGSRPPKGQVKEIEYAALNVARLLLDATGTRAVEMRAMYRNIVDGYTPTTRQRVDVGDIGSEMRNVPAPNAFSRLFNASSEDERAQAYGINPGTWGLARPFLELYVGVENFRDDNYGWGRFRGHLFNLVKLGFAVVLATQFGPAVAGALGLAEGTAAYAIVGGAVGGTASTLFITEGDWEAAFLGGISGGAASGLRFLSGIEGLPAGRAIVKALLLSRHLDGNESFEQSLSDVFDGQYLEGLGARIIAIENASPFALRLLEVIRISAVANGGDWEKILVDTDAFLVQIIGSELSGFSGDGLSRQWVELGQTLAGFARVVASSDGGEATAKRFFFDQVIPKLEFTHGGAFIERYGSPEELYANVGQTILDIVAAVRMSGGTMDTVDRSVERYVFALAEEWNAGL